MELEGGTKRSFSPDMDEHVSFSFPECNRDPLANSTFGNGIPAVSIVPKFPAFMRSAILL